MRATLDHSKGSLRGAQLGFLVQNFQNGKLFQVHKPSVFSWKISLTSMDTSYCEWHFIETNGLGSHPALGLKLCRRASKANLLCSCSNELRYRGVENDRFFLHSDLLLEDLLQISISRTSACQGDHFASVALAFWCICSWAFLLYTDFSNFFLFELCLSFWFLKLNTAVLYEY